MPLSICYLDASNLDASFLPLTEARVSPLDRGFLFADSVYEVLPVYAGRCFRLRQHLDRLQRSLASIRMAPPLNHTQWAKLLTELVERNGGGDMVLYLQVTRGMEFGRNHAWPEGLKPTVFAYANAMPPLAPEVASQGVAAVTAADTRWARRDIKSTALLANILLKKLSADAGAYETILLQSGELTEGSSTTVHAIIDGAICTPPNGHEILPGTTRSVVEELALRVDIPLRCMPISESQLRFADEIWLAFSTRGVLPVTRLDDKPVGDGSPGPLFRRMQAAFEDYIRELAGTSIL